MNRELNEVELKSQQEVRDAINVLFLNLNHMGNEKNVQDTVVDAVNRQHRTLQQEFVGHILVPIIQKFAADHEKGWFDLRNEASCKLCAELAKVCKDLYLPFI